MQQMLATAALVSCSRNELQTTKRDPTASTPPSPLPMPSAIPSASAASSAAADPPATAPTVVIAPPSATPSTKVSPPPTAGYLVVDMLPAPARCLGVAQASTAAGHFEAGGVLRIVITLKTAGVTFASLTPTAMGAQLVSSTFPTSTTADVVIRPTGGQLAGVNLPVTCRSSGSGTLFVHATFTGPPALGRPVNITLTDY